MYIIQLSRICGASFLCRWLYVHHSICSLVYYYSLWNEQSSYACLLHYNRNFCRFTFRDQQLLVKHSQNTCCMVTACNTHRWWWGRNQVCQWGWPGGMGGGAKGTTAYTYMYMYMYIHVHVHYKYYTIIILVNGYIPELCGCKQSYNVHVCEELVLSVSQLVC